MLSFSGLAISAPSIQVYGIWNCNLQGPTKLSRVKDKGSVTFEGIRKDKNPFLNEWVESCFQCKKTSSSIGAELKVQATFKQICNLIG